MSKVAVHGGIDLLGKDSNVKNLILEQLPLDNPNTNVGNIWLGLDDKKITYVEEVGQLTTIRRIAHDGDIAVLAEAIELKDNSTDTYLTITNIGTDDMTLGQPVYSTQNLEAKLANANDTIKKKVIGLVSDNLIESSGRSGKVLTSGLLTGTTEQWEQVTGMIGGLVPDSNYFLDIVAGKLTLYPPTEEGQFVCLLGTALTNTIFSIRIERPITI